MKVLVAGCGRMGAGMLRNLIAAGVDARGYDVRPPSAFPDLAVTDDPAAAADRTLLISVVRDAAQTEDVLFGAALPSRMPRLERVVISSTLSPRTLADVAARLEVPVVDAPMSGAQAKAEAGTLSFMVGGDDAGLAPLWDAMGASVHRMGPVGAGMTAKVLNNMMAAAAMASTRLALDWGRQAGLDPRAFLALAEASSGRNWFTGGWDEIEFAGKGWAEDNSVGILAKDVACALDAAPDGADTSLPRLLHDAIRGLKNTDPI